jgi:hypothetical protein
MTAAAADAGRQLRRASVTRVAGDAGSSERDYGNSGKRDEINNGGRERLAIARIDACNNCQRQST